MITFPHKWEGYGAGGQRRGAADIASMLLIYVSILLPFQLFIVTGGVGGAVMTRRLVNFSVIVMFVVMRQGHPVSRALLLVTLEIQLFSWSDCDATAVAGAPGVKRCRQKSRGAITGTARLTDRIWQLSP
jgi:hypothetical protein